MRKAIEKQEVDASLSLTNLQRKKRKIGSDLLEQNKTKRNLCEDRKFNEDEDFGKELNGARNLSPVIDICSNQPPNPVDGDDVEILEPGTIHMSPAIDICSNQLPNPVDGDDVEILEPGTIHKDNIDNEIADLNNNGECEWNDRKKFYVKKKFILEHQLPEKKERFTKRKNVKKNMKNNKKNEVDKNKKFYCKIIKEIEREFDSDQRKQIQKKLALSAYNERLVSLMPL